MAKAKARSREKGAGQATKFVWYYSTGRWRRVNCKGALFEILAILVKTTAKTTILRQKIKIPAVCFESLEMSQGH